MALKKPPLRIGGLAHMGLLILALFTTVLLPYLIGLVVDPQ